MDFRSGYVRITDAQTITGAKTFSSSGSVTSGDPSLKVQSDTDSSVVLFTRKNGASTEKLGCLGVDFNRDPIYIKIDTFSVPGGGSAVSFTTRKLVATTGASSSVGTATTPVYINNGIVQPITSYSGTAAMAVCEQYGNNIAETYARDVSGSAPSADWNLENLSPEGESKLHALKGYLDEGENLIDTEGLEDVLNYARSNYDSSKFHKEGTPVISNGVVSGFSSTNYVTCNLNVPYSHSVDIVMEVNLEEINVNHWLFHSAFTDTGAGIWFMINSSNVFRVFVGSGAGTAWDIANQVTGSHVFTTGKVYLRAQFTGSAYIFSYSSDKVNWTADITISSTAVAPLNATYYLGYGGSSNNLRGSIDLKEFSIYTDGFLAFSGVKTGVDTFKENDYTEVGSPVITSNGIASNLSTDNYCKLTAPSFALTNSDSWTIETPTYFLPDVTTQRDSVFQFASSGTNTLGAMLSLRSTSSFAAFIQSSTTSSDVLRAAVDFPANTEYLQVKYEHEISGLYKIYYSINKGPWILGASVTDTTSAVELDSTILMGYKATGCLVDLNRCKITLNGSVVYQPCLLIPYSESKTGSRIVEQFYRDRIEDIYDQYGFANYYTLAETVKENYLVYGSPTISSSYVASGFSAGTNIVEGLVSLESTKSFTMQGSFTIGSTVPSGYSTIIGMSGTVSRICVKSDAILGALNGGSSTVSGTDITISANTTYDFIFEYNASTGTVQLKVKESSESAYTNGSTSSGTIGNFSYSQVFFGSASASGSSDVFGGSVDLNAFKVYIDGILSYEAVTSKNFTLPRGDIYGLMRQSGGASATEVISSYYPLGDSSRIITDGADNTDWNTFTAPGTYKIENLTFTSEKHSPLGELNYGMLYVMKLKNGADSTDERTVQMYFPNGSSGNTSGTRGGICVRAKNGSTWFDWKKVYSKEANDLEYVSLTSNQTITGTKSFSSDNALGKSLAVVSTNGSASAVIMDFKQGSTNLGSIGVDTTAAHNPVFYNAAGTYHWTLVRGAGDNSPVGGAYVPVYISSSGVATACTVLNNTEIGNLGFSGTTTGQRLITQNSMAFWNGAYSGTNSNLRYCNGEGNEIVGTTNSQTISGAKTFSNAITTTDGNVNFNTSLAAIRKGADSSAPIFIVNNSAGQTALANTVSGSQNILLRPNGVSSTTAQVDIRYDGGIGLDNNSAIMKYNSTTEAIEFSFA